ncbi:NAD-dependent epimerase/dehydratase family protein [Candidatus Micrarchaeota archaeon]|nr:NAD-dependent epimerase/dehydratase family protein [Candidatus Micrarchaeota archaeon]
MNSRIYVTGASGRLGRAVLERMDATAVVRKKSGIEGETVTDFSGESLKKIFRDAKTVIHLAGSRDFLDKKKSMEGNVELTRRVVSALPPGARIVFSSSISVYGKRLADIPADEETPVSPDTPYAESKLRAERIVKSHPNHVILRIGPVYGPGFKEYFKVLRLIDKGKMSLMGDGQNHIPFVHVSDVVDAIESAVEKGNGVYVIVGECLPQAEVYRIASEKLGAGFPERRMPVCLARVFANLELLRTSLLGGNPLFIPEDIAVLSSDRVFNCSKARKELGFSPRPLERGIGEMVAEYKKAI